MILIAGASFFFFWIDPSRNNAFDPPPTHAPHGEVLYFSNYCLNRYYDKTPASLVSVVVVANGIWIAFPAAWMWVCWNMIAADGVALLR